MALATAYLPSPRSRKNGALWCQAASGVGPDGIDCFFDFCLEHTVVEGDRMERLARLLPRSYLRQRHAAIDKDGAAALDLGDYSQQSALCRAQDELARPNVAEDDEVQVGLDDIVEDLLPGLHDGR